MRKNRRLKKHAVMTMGSTGSFLLVFCICAALLICWSLDQRCTTISREIGKAERAYKALEAELGRENMRWAEMTSRRKLEEKLTRFGIQMRSQAPDQIVKMDAEGRPIQGLAYQRARARQAKSEMAANSAPPHPRTKQQQRVRR
ncbi:MAG: hypothetical protein ACI4Q3_07315 [Kiritimatiellia bacterium]